MSETNDSPRSTRAVAQAVLSAFQSHDLDAFREQLAPDACLIDVVSNHRVDGADAVIDAVVPTLAAFPDLGVEVVSLTVDGERAVAELMRRGTHTGPLRTPEGEIPATDQRARMPEVIVMEMDEGLVAEMRAYMDRHDIMKQLGVSTS